MSPWPSTCVWAQPVQALHDGGVRSGGEVRQGPGPSVLRVLWESRTDGEALDATAGRLRRLQDAFTAAATGSPVQALYSPRWWRCVRVS
ncbi:hypothetical protein CP967_33615 [Streptomyces nitrosporeus]|uniref:Uncharacterized protein n=1 Tax=Streptomyces nitrosporeus TaxID=28894 RepID=A0A5J6FK66_9ACTN|nr:hypothetical protein CP967_33615 [Streptomyces nitrosporeus]